MKPLAPLAIPAKAGIQNFQQIPRIVWEESRHHGRLFAIILTAAYFLSVSYFIHLQLFPD
jgi:hypothetical protein